MPKTVASSLNGAGSTYGSYASSNLESWQQPVMPAGTQTVTLGSPWPQFPDAVRQGGTAVTPQITVTGGTVSSITIGGGSSVGTSGTFNVLNVQPVVISYSVAPTVTWSCGPFFQKDPLNAKTAVSA